MELFNADTNQPGQVITFRMEYGERISEDSIPIHLVWCPPGKFLMGTSRNGLASGNEKPRWEVTISEGFWMSETTITDAQWIAGGGSKSDLPHYKGGDFPVSNVAWGTAREFCEQLTQATYESHQGQGVVSLPSEAQWEYACRAGNSADDRWYFGDDESELEKHAWYRHAERDRRPRSINPVKLKQPNLWGLYDLYGNVEEWCLDASYYYPYLTNIDPVNLTGAEGRKVTRGGLYSSRPHICNSTSRLFISHDNLHNNVYDTFVGLRVVFNFIVSAATA